MQRNSFQTQKRPTQKRWKMNETEHKQTNMGYLLCSALSLDTSPPPPPSPSLPTARICLLMAWQISLAAAIWAFSPSRPPRVARRAKETQRREYTASTCVCVARGCATSSSTCDRNVAKLRSSHWPPSVVTNTTYACKRRGEDKASRCIFYLQFCVLYIDKLKWLVQNQSVQGH